MINDSKLCRLQCPITILFIKSDKIFKYFFLGEPLFWLTLYFCGLCCIGCWANKHCVVCSYTHLWIIYVTPANYTMFIPCKVTQQSAQSHCSIIILTAMSQDLPTSFLCCFFLLFLFFLMIFLKIWLRKWCYAITFRM